MKLNRIVLILLLIFPATLFAAHMKPYSGPTPDLKLNDIHGVTHQISDYTDKIVLVQFWATYCTPCRKEMPSMNRLLEKMDGNLEILAINMGETLEEVNTFTREIGLSFPVLMDEDAQALTEWKVYAAPSNFIIDKQGKIRYTLFGGVEWDDQAVVDFLNKLLDE